MVESTRGVAAANGTVGSATGDQGISIANPLRAGSAASDNDFVTYFPDGTIDFVVGGELWDLGPDGSAFRAQGDNWTEQQRVPAQVRRIYAQLASSAANPYRAGAAAAGTSSTRGPGAPASANAPAAPAATAPMAPSDTVERGNGAAATVTGAASMPADDRLAALERRMNALEQENRNQADELAAERHAREAREAQEAEEARKPSFWRTLVEIFEFLARFMLPVVNLISACVRVVKIAYKLIKGEKVDWGQEGLRLLGDVAGCFFPPAGAIANTGFNIWFDRSQILGGVNEIEDLSKIPLAGKALDDAGLIDHANVRDQFRMSLEDVWNGISGAAGWTWRHITGRGDDDAVEAGSSDDTGVEPTRPVERPAEVVQPSEVVVG